jgi:hypothetical protein
MGAWTYLARRSVLWVVTAVSPQWACASTDGWGARVRDDDGAPTSR